MQKPFTKRSLLIILSALAALAAAGLACNLPINRAAPEPTLTPVAFSTQAVGELENAIEAAVTVAQSGGTVEITITDAQLTSAIALQLQNQPQLQQQASISNVQAHLQNGQILLAADVSRSGVTLPARLILTIEVDAQGVPHTRLLDASLGAIPIPQAILDQITAQIDQNLVSTIGATMFVEAVTISKGKMTVRAHPR